MTRFKKFAITVALLAAVPAAVLAQRVIPAGETTSPGTYLNVCGPPGDTSTYTSTTACAALLVKSIMMVRNGASSWIPWSAIGQDPGGSSQNGTPLVSAQEGTTANLNVSTSTVIKASAGRLYRVSVVTAGSTTGAIHNTTTTGAAAAANLVGVIPNTVGIYLFNWPMTSGIVYIPGTGQVVAISYN